MPPEKNLPPGSSTSKAAGSGKNTSVHSDAQQDTEGAATPGGAPGLTFTRYFSTDGVHPYDAVEWEQRDAVIERHDGDIVFEQRGVQFPVSWSQRATNIVASKYFHGQLGGPERETSLKQLIGRVVGRITQWGIDGGYFGSDESAEVFSEELTHLLLHQYVAFNSPVWFNLGVEGERQQASACYINHVDDKMESILDLAKTEGLIFKWGSGAGVNLSRLRGSTENLSGGGVASGPVSFMKGFDAFAGVIKSGGKTRRAAKMIILDVDHPDIVEFIECKGAEERKAWALIEAGYDPALDGEAYASVFFQNANHSVRASDAFMRAVESGSEWETLGRVDGQPVSSHSARDIMAKIAYETWHCGDPGMQYDDTINRWHTCKATDRIYGSNPCSEYMFLDETACNLASLNLMKFMQEDGSVDVQSYRKAVATTFTAMEIVVGYADYPTEAVTKNSHDYRPLGLGYANLGALLMHQGLPYDSENGRTYSAALTAIMTGEAYAQSAKLAAVKGPFAGYPENEESMLGVMQMHRDAAYDIDDSNIPADMARSAREVWDRAVELGEEHGYRNAQATVLAPTGTISFMMDCDTTGVEPDLALVKHKRLVGGGTLKIVNESVPTALQRLGYTSDQVESIVAHIDETGTIEGAEHLQDKHLAVFDCAFRAPAGERSIHHMGHIRMLAATQPFISGAISKTVNMPAESNVEDIADAYAEAWRLGIKAVAIYRDGSKMAQPLATSAEGKSDKRPEVVVAGPVRRKLPDERHSFTHKFGIAGHKGYITVGLYEDGSPGEVFITMAKEGSTISGLMDSFASMTSFALQYGVPLKFLVQKCSNARFEPSGYTGNQEIPFAKSITDYIFRWMANRFLTDAEKVEIGLVAADSVATDADDEGVEAADDTSIETTSDSVAFVSPTDAPTCPDCGSLMVVNGNCHKCQNCGSTSGCS
ncbi:MAG: vitamin B12-dependent ribonucleotide reductase [Acidobacteria bacterium]|nr:vitamin B12-dependent ribonucleotide reductase [Acidobacteriota bacterium]